MNRTNIYPVMHGRVTAQMLAGEPIRIDGMKLVFDQKVAMYPAKLRVEDKNGESDSDSAN
jgi:hypothetical protein